MELGGKSPVVVFEDADPELAVDAALAQIFTLERPALHGGIAAARRSGRCTTVVVGAIAERARNIRVGDPFDKRTELGPLIHPEHHERVLGYIESAREEGATVLAGGQRPPELDAGNFLEATVIGGRRRDDEGLPRGDLRAGARCDARSTTRRRPSGSPTPPPTASPPTCGPTI